jgi:hypothetical protein
MRDSLGGAINNQRPPDFGPAWQRYRRVERRYWAGFLGGAVGLCVFFTIVKHNQLLFDIGMGLGALLVLVTPLWTKHSRRLICPYCDQRFYRRAFRRFDPATCVHCGAKLPSIWRDGPA